MSERRVPGAVVISGIALLAAALAARWAGRARGAVALQPAAAAPDQDRTRDAALRRTRPGRPAAGGFRAAWPLGGRDAAVAPELEFQYANLPHQVDAAVSGMWLFLATEILFFGGLFLLYAVYRSAHPAVIAEASRHAELGIGTVNTVLLVSSSAVFAYGLGCVQAGRARALFCCCVVTAAIGVIFVALKGYEWKLDFDDNMFPGPSFGIKGPDAGPAQLFWCFYFIATGLHGLHMIVGVVLVAWIARGARRGLYSPAYHTPVEIVGLDWSFVDMIWLLLFPMIYLAGGLGR